MVWGEDFIPNVYLNGFEQSGIDRLGEDFIRTLKWVDAINQVNVQVINVDEFVSNIQKFLCPIRNTVSIIVIFLLFWRTAHDFKFGSKLAEQPAAPVRPAAAAPQGSSVLSHWSFRPVQISQPV